MTSTYLNKTHRFFYFQTRIYGRISGHENSELWLKMLEIIKELHDENGVVVYGLTLDGKNLKIAFSTPYFNENILVLDWELRLKVYFPIGYDRPILCEPILGIEEIKNVLMEMYRTQIDIQKNKIRWRNPFNSLKLIVDGDRHAQLFSDPLRVVFQPHVVFQIVKNRTHSAVF